MSSSESFWLINSKRIEVKRFPRTYKNEDKFCENKFMDKGKIFETLR